MELDLQDLTGSVGSGWLGVCGYYIHRDRVYLQGEVEATGSGVGTLLLTLPPAARPAADTPLSLIADLNGTQDPATPGISNPTTFAGTVSAAGALTISGLPPYVDTAPDPAVYKHYDDVAATFKPDFPNPLQLTVLLVNLSWPVGGTIGDTPTYLSAASYLAGGDFSDVSAEIAVHDARVHLAGQVRANINGASTLFPSLPAGFRTAVDDDTYTRVSGPSHDFGVPVDTGGLVQVTSDSVDPAITPTWPISTWFHAPTFVGLWNGDLVFGHVNKRYYYTLGTFPLDTPTVWSYGNNFGPCGLDLFGSPIMCASLGAGGAFTASLTRWLGQWSPQPDWFMAKVTAQSTPGNGLVIFKGVNSCAGGGGCGPYVNTGDLVLTADAGFTLVDNSNNPIAPSANPTSTGTANAETYSHSLQGWLKRTSGGYPDNDSNLASSLLWKPGEIDAVTLTSQGQSNHCDAMSLQVEIVPFWEARKQVIKAGDVIDLIGAGWQSAFTPPSPVLIPPGAMIAGAHQAGFITR